MLFVRPVNWEQYVELLSILIDFLSLSINQTHKSAVIVLCLVKTPEDRTPTD